ncbi:hypothetical protein EBI00_02440 [Marinomonas hwangdonensis]|uniref:Uncharacterized protein n=1 Tax=Marinomonas hwangdonensis TaxID=1053647 RepID=A0A3M8QA82_9GAMM|nr:hypothetical protein [Marinomonas hwangdonensis]RNF52978.1 hypothetical protein EBI00_02440 [Marinomonas hwangdonensis]
MTSLKIAISRFALTSALAFTSSLSFADISPSDANKIIDDFLKNGNQTYTSLEVIPVGSIASIIMTSIDGRPVRILAHQNLAFKYRGTYISRFSFETIPMSELKNLTPDVINAWSKVALSNNSHAESFSSQGHRVVTVTSSSPIEKSLNAHALQGIPLNY